MDNTLPDHHLWVVVFDALDPMIPLLKRYLGLSRGGITTEGIDTGSTHPHPSPDYAEESANIHIELRGLTGHDMGLPYLYPLSLLESNFSSSVTASPLPKGPLDFPRVIPEGVHPPPSRPYQFGEPLVLPTADHCQGPDIPG